MKELFRGCNTYEMRGATWIHSACDVPRYKRHTWCAEKRGANQIGHVLKAKKRVSNRVVEAPTWPDNSLVGSFDAVDSVNIYYD